MGAEQSRGGRRLGDSRRFDWSAAVGRSLASSSSNQLHHSSLPCLTRVGLEEAFGAGGGGGGVGGGIGGGGTGNIGSSVIDLARDFDVTDPTLTRNFEVTQPILTPHLEEENEGGVGVEGVQALVVTRA